jgi:hypothetical protein
MIRGVDPRACDARFEIEAVEQRSTKPACAAGRRRLQRDRESCRAPRDGFVPSQHADRLTPFHHALQAQPRGERQATDRVLRRVAHVEDHQAEVAGLEHEPERLDRLFHGTLIEIAAETRVGDHAAANPEQAREIGTSRFGRGDVQHVEGIHQRDQFAAGRGRSDDVEEKAGAS